MTGLRIGIVSGLAAVMLLTGGCGEDPKTAIVGSWAANNGVQDLHFSADGSTTIDDHKLNRVYEGKCEFETSDTMRCRYDRFSFDVVRQVSISGDELVLTSSSGQEEHYRRMR